MKPRDAGEQFQYEGELVAVFGKRCRNVSKEEALDYVFGWTIGNDVSERTWQANDRTLWRAKNCDTFKPMGPWIVTGADLDAMVTTIRLNGRVTETFKTNNMIFDAPTYISEVSKYCTIEPGDVMWMGTDGVPANMKPGDVCEIEISRDWGVAEQGGGGVATPSVMRGRSAQHRSRAARPRMRADAAAFSGPGLRRNFALRRARDTSYCSFLTHPAIASTTAFGCSGSSAWLAFGITATVTRSGNSSFSSFSVPFGLNGSMPA